MKSWYNFDMNLFKPAIRTVMIACLLSMVLSLAGSLVSAGALSWKPFISKQGRFSIMMPGKPAFTSKTSQSPVGEIGENLYCFENGIITVSAQFTDLPGLAAIFGGWGRIYRESRKAFLAEVGGDEISARNVIIDAYRGKELIYRTSTDYGKVRFYLVGKRLYVLQASVPHQEGDRAMIDYFLESFQPIYRNVKTRHHG